MQQCDVYYDLNATAHQTKVNAFSSAGYRLLSLSAYGEPTDPRYAVVWLQHDGPPWVTRHGMRGAALQHLFAQWTQQGYRMTIVTATGRSGEAAIFAAVFERSSALDWFARHRLVSGLDTDPRSFQYQCKFAQNNGYILTWVAVYGTAATPLYAGIWERNLAASGWEYRLNESDMALQHDLVAFNGSGGEPELMTRSDATSSYLTIWHRVAHDQWWADHSLTAPDLAARLAQNQTRSIYPLRLQGAGASTQTRFTVKWGSLPRKCLGAW
jgi:hypothetical protein